MEILSVLSTIIAVIAAVVSVITYYEMRKIAKIQTNLDLVNKGNDHIKEAPVLLELHGIKESDLQECGVDHHEFIYILNSLYAGQAYHFIEGAKKVTLSPYRKTMLDHDKVKRTWVKLIRKNMLAGGPFSDAIDEYYDLK